MRVLFCNVGWMEFYRGLSRGDAIKGGGSFVETEERGGEVCNFEPHGGFVYGYVRPPGKTIDTKRIYEKLQEKADDYRLAIVTDAISRTPRLMICRFSGERREWIVETEGKADGRMEIEPRSSARVRVVPAPA